MPRFVTSEAMVGVSADVAVTVKMYTPAKSAPNAPTLILAHGANNTLDFPLLAFLATRLAETSRVRVVRFNFPYVERGLSSPDPRAVLESTFLRVYDHVVEELSLLGSPIFVGGKSIGGRAAAELVSRCSEGQGVVASGLIVLGYPLHSVGREDHLYVEPLRHIDIPSLFCVGSRDSLCNPNLLRPILADLVHPGTLYVVEGGDHSLHLPPDSGKQPQDSYEEVAGEIAGFIERLTS